MHTGVYTLCRAVVQALSCGVNWKVAKCWLEGRWCSLGTILKYTQGFGVRETLLFKKNLVFFVAATLDNLLSAVLPFVRNEDKEEYLLHKFVVNIN